MLGGVGREREKLPLTRFDQLVLFLPTIMALMSERLLFIIQMTKRQGTGKTNFVLNFRCPDLYYTKFRNNGPFLLGFPTSWGT
jgi:hypothetical protein